MGSSENQPVRTSFHASSSWSEVSSSWHSSPRRRCLRSCRTPASFRFPSPHSSSSPVLGNRTHSTAQSPPTKASGPPLFGSSKPHGGEALRQAQPFLPADFAVGLSPSIRVCARPPVPDRVRSRSTADDLARSMSFARPHSSTPFLFGQQYHHELRLVVSNPS